MSLVLIGKNRKKSFILPFLDLASTLEVLLPTPIHKTLGQVQTFLRYFKESEEPFRSVK